MDEEMRKLFASNLKKYLKRADKTQADLARYMKVSSATVSDWVHGKKIPRTDKLQSISNWLGIEISNLISDEEASSYYLDPETARAAQDVYIKHRGLFDAARDATPEAIQAASVLLEKLKETNPDG